MFLNQTILGSRGMSRPAPKSPKSEWSEELGPAPHPRGKGQGPAKLLRGHAETRAETEEKRQRETDKERCLRNIHKYMLCIYIFFYLYTDIHKHSNMLCWAAV